jgi:hypothetical protein
MARTLIFEQVPFNCAGSTTMTCSADTTSKPRTMAAAAIAILLSLGSFVTAASAEDFSTGIRLWAPDTFGGQGPLRGLHYFAPPADAYAAPFTGTASKYPLQPLYSGARVGVTLDSGVAP